MTAAALAAGLWAATGGSAAADFGKPGEPIALTVGHPCCYAPIWSAYVVREKEFWKPRLPVGSTVTFDIGLAGPVVVNAMLAGKQQVGYLGDMPAIVATTKTEVADVRLVATTSLAYDQCNILLVRKDAPAFPAPKDAVKWLADKQFAVPRGSCGDRFAKDLLTREGVTPAAYLNQTIEVITSSFKAGKLDGAVVWEPVASQAVNQGIARRAASGTSYGIQDGAFLAMRADLMAARPDVARGWLEAELDAQLFMADEKNAAEVVRIIRKHVPAYTEADLMKALYGRYPEAEGGTPVRMIQPFGFPPDVRTLLADATTFLHAIKGIAVPTMRPEAVDAGIADAILADRKLSSPVGRIEATD